MRIIFLGAPGVGKGTQSKLVSERFGLTHISTGDLFRDHISNRSILGNQIKHLIDKGELVPDELTVAMVRDRISAVDCEKGFVLDGFPRNQNQAKELDMMLAATKTGIDKAILLDLPKQVILERIAGRRFCPKCGASYHVSLYPSIDGCTCDCCNEVLHQRMDDREEIVLERLNVFERTARPLIDYYSARGILHRAVGHDHISSVFEQICDNLLAI